MSAPAAGRAPGQRSRTGPSTYDQIVRASGGKRDLRRLPRLIGAAFGLVWRSAPRQLLSAGTLQVLAGLSVAAQLLVIRRLLTNINAAEGIPTASDLGLDLALFGALVIVVGIATVTQKEQQLMLGDRVHKYTTAQVMAVSTTVDLIEYEKPSFHDRLQRARVNANIRPLQMANGVIGLIGSGVGVAAVGAALLVIEPVVAALIVVGGVPTMLLNRLSSRLMHAFAVRQTHADRRRAYLYQTLSRKEEAQEVRAFDSSAHLLTEHDRLFDERIEDLGRTARRRIVYGTLASLNVALVTIGSLVLLLYFVRVGRTTATDAVVALGAVLLIAGRIRALTGSMGSLYEGALFLEDFTVFVDEYGGNRRAFNGEHAIPPFERIDLDHVSFTYPSRTEPSLEDVSLTLRQGEVIALVGENGSGKTTLTKLLAGLYRPSEGAVCWDGRDLAEVDLTAVREHVTVIFQDFARYFLTAHENVSISRSEDMDDAELVREAAVRAGADGFLSSLPNGYRTLLGPSFVGGSDLSIGQWQRVALARAYFRDAPLLILDEPTAALDPRGEYEIFQQVRRLARGRTVVLVSHRFSSVRAADRILVLRSGRIVEDGDHETLLAENGLYAELFRLQAEGYRGVSS
jgi:ATP-binding cassette, subfamily B, bacterial